LREAAAKKQGWRKWSSGKSWGHPGLIFPWLEEETGRRSVTAALGNGWAVQEALNQPDGRFPCAQQVLGDARWKVEKTEPCSSPAMGL